MKKTWIFFKKYDSLPIFNLCFHKSTRLAPLLSPFYSMQAFDWLAKAHLY